MTTNQGDHCLLPDLHREIAAQDQGAPIVLLMPVDDGAVVGLAPAGRPGAATIHTLRFGTLLPASRLLKHDPPTSAELEHAIEVIEDAVMPIGRQMMEGSVLFVSSPVLEPLWRTLTSEGGEVAPLSIDEVEAQFLSLAAIAEGRPTTSSDVPGGTAFAWQMLVLREAMHHWGFAVAHRVR